MECPGIIAGSRWFVSERCRSAFGAREDLSRKVIHDLMLMYNFKVVDVNYDSQLRLALQVELERESFLSVSERIYGVQAEKEFGPPPALAAPGTPKGVDSMIPKATAAPKVPRKRVRCSTSDTSEKKLSGNLVPAAVVAYELDRIASCSRNVAD